MKALFCQDCLDIVVPDMGAGPRWCYCGRHAIWCASSKVVSLCDTKAERRLSDGVTPADPRAFIILIANELLTLPDETVTAADVRRLTDIPRGDHPFTRTQSLIYRMRPDELIQGQRRAVWATLPSAKKIATG